eukprot:GILI01021300.1.p1 GENE.GILI01021300.1~~GILI01021300.1.p1  ORF type:complete len:158 (-),score=14.84 GILI01021300.1:103-576(-)
MPDMIGTIGVGLFAVLMVAAFAFVIALILSYMMPNATFFIFVGCAILPVLTFGIIMSAPYEPLNTNIDYSAPLTAKPALPKLPATVFYPNDGISGGLDDIIDKWLPVRVTLMVLLCVGILFGLGYNLVLALTAPPYVAPQVQCIRRQLEEMYPTRYR